MHLSQLAADHGSKPALVMGTSQEVMTYAELDARSNQIAHLFRQLGLRPGDHVAHLMRNQLELFPVVWAAQRAGLYHTPVNWHLAAAEAAYILADSGARVLVSDAELETLAASASVAAPALEARYVIGDVAGVQGLDNVIGHLPTTPIADEVEGCYMFYSSGTTGRPKGVKRRLAGDPFGTGLPVDHLLGSMYELSTESVYLCPGPLYHAAPLGWSLATIRNGGTVVVMERFEPRVALALMARHQVTHAQFVPTMFVRMLKLPPDEREGYELSSLRFVVHAAAPCSPEVKQRMIEWLGPIVYEYYAGSEGNGFCMIDSATWLERRGSVGRPVTGEVHICDGHGNELGAGEIGTIWFSGSAPFEYHNDPEKTRAAYNDRGWSTLGDLGHVDADGFVYLSGRRTDLIISGGVNIYPQEIEDVLIMHPAVTDVAVIGLPDDDLGQRVHAVIEPADGHVTDRLADELIGYCKERIAHFKTPRSVSFESSFPRLPSGKVLKRELLARYAGSTTDCVSPMSGI